MRSAIIELVTLGLLPTEKNAKADQLEKIEALVRAIEAPLTDEEAEAIVSIFGNDGCFGLAWSVLHLVETAPGWPIGQCLSNSENMWIGMLISRLDDPQLVLRISP